MNGLNFIMELEEIKQNICKVLEMIKLSGAVSLDEIQKEILRVETAFQSLLLLGILARIMHRNNEKAMALFLPAITEWKNYLPHKDLGGMTPDEHIKKYPVGPHEAFLIRNLLEEYQQQLDRDPDKNPEDIENDFGKFQKEYLGRVPMGQVFSGMHSGLMTIRDIIVEERRRNGRPKKDINKIGIKILAENTAEGSGWRMAEVEDRYFTSLQEMKAMQQDPALRDRKRVSAIRKQFEKDESYHRCGPAPHQFYLNYAAVVLLDGGNKKIVKELLERSLSFDPNYDIALQMKESLNL